MQTHCKHCETELQEDGNYSDARHLKHTECCCGCIDNDFFECESCGELTQYEDGVKEGQWLDANWYCNGCAVDCDIRDFSDANDRADFQIKEMKECA